MDEGFLHQFERILGEAAAEMLAIPEDTASRPRAPGKWSRKEIVGHLIDSAVNNQARFVRALLEDDLVFAGYAQDQWVRAQRYQNRSWPELVNTWQAFNGQVAAVMRATPPSEANRLRSRHNLHEIAFQAHPADAPGTLGFLMRDYVVHLEHHLRQVLG